MNKTENFITNYTMLDNVADYKTKVIGCKGCPNNCTITKFIFASGKIYYSGNKCEKVFSSKGDGKIKGFNFHEYKYDLLFNRSGQALGVKKGVIGIPRVLNIYENFPFWNTLFTQCGFDVQLSDEPTMKLIEQGFSSVMSDSICFPAKVVNGHIINLAEKKPDRIFYPMVYYEKEEFKDAENSFMCPIVSSYSEVIKSALNPEKKFAISFDALTINFNNEKLLKKQLRQYLSTLGVSGKIFENAFETALIEREIFHAQIKQKGAELIENAQKSGSTLIVLAGRPYHIDPLISHKTGDVLCALGIDFITEDAVPNEFDITNIQIISQWLFPNRIINAAQWTSRQPANIQFIQMNSFACGPDAVLVDECKQILESAGKTNTIIRVDEITSIGSVRLRLRSLIESLKLNLKENYYQAQNRKNVSIFKERDRTRKIIAPHFGAFYSDLIPPLFKAAGYELETLPQPNKKSVDYGLRFANNEICYPATIIVGDIIKALQSGYYNREEIAIGITQTGGQCRASTYLSLIKKAMISAGYSDIPVISIGPFGKTLNEQPGFEINWFKMLPVTIVAMLFADSLAALYHKTVVREKIKGSAEKLKKKYIEKVGHFIENNQISPIFVTLNEMVKDFNQLETYEKNYPRVGLVGEIYVKYNTFGHGNISEWLVEKGVEVVFPPLTEFFTKVFVNTHVNKQKKLVESGIKKNLLLSIFQKYTERYIRKFNKILKNSKYNISFHEIEKMAKKAERIIDLSSQFGEGWLIPAEIAQFAEEGINSVVSVQPFGCIANQIISKGVEKRIKELYPHMNLLYLDFDDGAGEVNIQNRLHFMLENLKYSKA